ncbi:MAG: 50S ribosomal protein L30 [Candidatus Izemoplasmatales bacterium]|jgi:large subunit ribosomal protein L30|nr:50S ribosomal protein L30 [Candidatus Izemoplasmatales bacterium]MDD4595238.1 50S ribosomal protein L30 [Candidatus Izemoplasmatales bacterium]
MAQIQISLIKSLIGHKPNQIKTVKALGLTKVHSSVLKEDTEAIREMIASVSHLVKIEETK